MEVLGAGKNVNRGSEVKERSRKGQGHCSVILHPRLPHIFLCGHLFSPVYGRCSGTSAGEWKVTHPGDSPLHTPHAAWLQNRKEHIGSTQVLVEVPAPYNTGRG